MTMTNVPLRMHVVFDVLERALDNKDIAVVAACRRLICANRLGWRKHADPATWRLVKAFAED
jgi:hypothetical protein